VSDASLPGRTVERVDESPDPLFYREPRFVAHIDDATIAALTQLYRERLPAGCDVLDLMSSWISHLPADVEYGRVAGLGMNDAELRANERLSESVVHDLNAAPTLPFDDASFDAVLIAVSVQYLTRPVEVFEEIRRALRPDGQLLVAVSHRTFPTKCVALFRSLPPAERPSIVARYAELAGGFSPASLLDRSPPPSAGGRLPDPLWVVALEPERP
jgi:SAM-dependent methyltransferase